MSTVAELLHGVTAVWTIYSNLFHLFFLSSQKDLLLMLPYCLYLFMSLDTVKAI